MQSKAQKVVIFNRICIVCFVCMTMCYNISWDLFIITLFMVSAFCIGDFFLKKAIILWMYYFSLGLG